MLPCFLDEIRLQTEPERHASIEVAAGRRRRMPVRHIQAKTAFPSTFSTQPFVSTLLAASSFRISLTESLSRSSAIAACRQEHRSLHNGRGDRRADRRARCNGALAANERRVIQRAGSAARAAPRGPLCMSATPLRASRTSAFPTTRTSRSTRRLSRQSAQEEPRDSRRALACFEAHRFHNCCATSARSSRVAKPMSDDPKISDGSLAGHSSLEELLAAHIPPEKLAEVNRVLYGARPLLTVP